MKEYFERLTNSINSHEKIVLMTHSVPDLDGLGSAIAFCEIVKKLGKKCEIVAPKKLINKTLNKGIQYLKDEGFIIPFKYEKSIDGDMLVIFDASENYLIECPDLLTMKDRFIIDHHSLGDDIISGDMFLDDSKSSTVEIICEYLKYLDLQIDSRIYTVLYAGLYQDSNGFVLKTLPRTFEIASYLLTSGANINLSYSILKESMESITSRYDYIKKSEEISDGIYLCVLDDRQCTRMTLAKVADEMIRFEEASAAIAVGRHGNYTLVSARSCGNVDVFSFMKKLGGGGHFGAAAARCDESIENIILKIKKIVMGEI